MAKGKIKADTLLRKIQKGTSNLSEKTRAKLPGFSFKDDGGISLFRKREIVQPYLHPIDSRLLNEEVEKTVKNDLREIDPEIDKNFSKLLPKHLVNDLFSLYYNPSGRLKFEEGNNTNKIKFDILESINNSLIKIVTNDSHLGSYVYTEEIGKFLYKKFMEMPPEDRKKLEEALDQCNQGDGSGNDKNEQGKAGGKPTSGDEDGEGTEEQKPDRDLDHQGRRDSDDKEDSKRDPSTSFRGRANNSHGKNSQKDMSQEAADKMDQALKDMVNNLNSKQSKRDLEKHMQEAEKKLDKLREVGVDLENDQEMPDEERKEIIKNLNNLDSIRYSLSRLNVGKDKILKAVEKILNGASNYFSPKCITKDVELFEADQILDINGIELLHPAFRRSRIMDLSITERKYIGKFDLYVDCSGSMGSGCGGDLNGVARIDLAKSLAMQMKQLGILGDLYEFEDRPKKIMNTDMSILMMDARGGTNIEYVMKNILKNGNNAVVLSDGESYVESYSHKALFIGVGTDFHYFKSQKEGNAGRKFIDQNQCIHYDGKNFVQSK